ncbi:hypothetical protein J437_LFUL004038 [Ladona fulva]|uniref:Uncharacterized protein n=1 Tax=Ladona fulva TaxID=123851 RepID=A0A8K0JWH8_LADFU|nr:hypothetical protein J437_LFUL004038 [Ladona fulva]
MHGSPCRTIMKIQEVNPLLALEALQRPVSHWDDLIVFLNERKLLVDTERRRSWEVKLEDSSIPPTYKALKAFMKTKNIDIK